MALAPHCWTMGSISMALVSGRKCQTASSSCDHTESRISHCRKSKMPEAEPNPRKQHIVANYLYTDHISWRPHPRGGPHAGPPHMPSGPLSRVTTHVVIHARAHKLWLRHTTRGTQITVTDCVTDLTHTPHAPCTACCWSSSNRGTGCAVRV